MWPKSLVKSQRRFIKLPFCEEIWPKCSTRANRLHGWIEQTLGIRTQSAKCRAMLDNPGNLITPALYHKYFLVSRAQFANCENTQFHKHRNFFGTGSVGPVLRNHGPPLFYRLPASVAQPDCCVPLAFSSVGRLLEEDNCDQSSKRIFTRSLSNMPHRSHTATDLTRELLILRGSFLSILYGSF